MKSKEECIKQNKTSILLGYWIVNMTKNDLLKTIKDWFLQNPNTYEILTSRIEAIDIQNNMINANETFDLDNGIRNIDKDDDNASNNSTDDSNTKTVLTTQDGIANRIIGHKKQEEMAQYLRDVGFEIIDGHGAGEPDFIIKKKKTIGYDFDGTGRGEEKRTMEIVAVGSCKSYTLKDQPKKKQRKISPNHCIPEITLAKRLHIPMIILVTNRNNNRRWATKISYDELVNADGKGKKWDGISTPVMLSQDDPESGQELEEKFCSVLASIGASV